MLIPISVSKMISRNSARNTLNLCNLGKILTLEHGFYLPVRLYRINTTPYSMVLPIQFVFVHKLLYFVFILKYLWQENPIFCRVVNVLRHWVDHHYYDFERDQTLLHKLNIFLKNVKGKAMKKMAESILKVIRRRVRDIRIMAIDIHTSTCICVHLSYNYMYIQVKIWILLNMKDKCSTFYILSLNQKWYVDSSLCLYFS